MVNVKLRRSGGVVWIAWREGCRIKIKKCVNCNDNYPFCIVDSLCFITVLSVDSVLCFKFHLKLNLEEVS